MPDASSGLVSTWYAESTDALVDFAQRHRMDITDELTTFGAVLFKGFPETSDLEFKDLVECFGGEVLEYNERSSPRRQIIDRVYSSTEYPADQEIFYHNENSYQIAWPRVLGFVCREAASSGGETMIANCRSVLAGMDQDVASEFAEHGWSYVRNFYPGLGLGWQEVFGTSSRSEVDGYCRSHRLRSEWIGTSRLRVTSDKRSAVAAHPVTGESIWFNHAAFFHYSTLPEEISSTLYAGMALEDLPSNTYFGDGTSVSVERMEKIRKAYRDASQLIDWAPGDVLLIDNMLTSHGRRAFTGNRRISVAMAGAIRADDIDTNAGRSIRREHR